jgi:acetylornithine deacetylase/succinyl-diaminopimelate desuccinylase-like protein
MQQVEDYLSEHRERFVRELSEYIKFPSVSAQSHHKKDLNACAHWLLEHCRAIGLDVDLFPTTGNPIILARTPPSPKGAKRPHFLVYGHYDVQPPEPLELWTSPPFEPRLEKNAIFGRGASDNKGQHFAHLKAVEAYLKTGTDLPCDLTFLIEGEEEVGSRSLSEFLRKKRTELRCQAVVISDTGLISLRHPTFTYALRGICACEIRLQGPSRDLHSGIFGGSVENPAMALCQLLGKLRDSKGRITIPGFYDEVLPLSRFERRQLARHPFDPGQYRKFLGVPELFGEHGFTPIEQRSARPTFEINGLTSGYQGEGSKTIVPSWAKAKITMRLVPNQRPAKIARLVKEHLQRLCPPTMRMELTFGHGADPYLVSPESPLAKATLGALETAYNCEPVLMREGGSIPIVTEFKKLLGADSLMLGMALPDDNAHSPNEKFDLRVFAKGALMSACLWPELANAERGTRSGERGTRRA